MSYKPRAFIASTYLDNEERRRLVINVLERAGIEPIGMELWSADRRPTVESCLDEARSADLLIGILGHKYGWVPEGYHKSITELEYDAQPERLMFLVDDSVAVDPADIDAPMHTPEFQIAQAKLHKFKQRISRGDENRPVPFRDENFSTLLNQAIYDWLKQQQSGLLVPGGRVAVGPIELLPNRFSEKIGGNEAAKAGLLAMIAATDAVLQRRGYFVGRNEPLWAYVRGRLWATDAMISTESWDRLTSNDVSCLCAAVLLHAFAFGLTPRGFLSLIDGSREWSGKPARDGTTWAQRWKAFFAEACKFDGRYLMVLFGDTEPVRPLPNSADNFTDRDRALVSVFLKRNHGAIVTVFAKIGKIPGPAGESIDISRDGVHLELAALVARSLGGSIRETYEELDGSDQREIKHIHAPYLMALLNLGAYFQLDREKKPQQTLPISALVEPAIREHARPFRDEFNITNTANDPEALSVNVIPESVGSYNGIRGLLDRLQVELDRAWAVVGEVYGPVPELRNLGFSIRRVRSNLNDPTSLSGKVSYVPDRIAFDSAGVEMLKLLITPLYGRRPVIGVRELLQNAVDAVKEYRQLTGSTPSADEGFSEDVLITYSRTDEDGAVLEVLDRGVGMTLHTIKNYFLIAGASLRRSPAWKEAFIDETGHATVARSGRFGIGVFAAFLLGDRIEVWTRHYAEPEDRGFAFSASIDDELLEVRQVAQPRGTRIKIHVDKSHVIAELDDPRLWDWYCAAFPKVRRLTPRGEAGQGIMVPDQPDSKWIEVAAQGYRRVLCTQEQERLICNGILIGENPQRTRMPYINANKSIKLTRFLAMRRPAIAVEDADGLLPLNLERTQLVQAELPPELLQPILQSVVTSFVKQVRNLSGPKRLRLIDQIVQLRPNRFQGVTSLQSSFSKSLHPALEMLFWFSDHGLSFVDPKTLWAVGIKRILVVPFPASGSPSPGLSTLINRVGDGAVIPMYGETPLSIPHAYSFFRNVASPEHCDTFFHELGIRGYRVLVAEHFLLHSTYSAGFQNEFERMKKHATEWVDNGHHLIAVGDVPEASFPFQDALPYCRSAQNGLVLELYTDTFGYGQDVWPLFRAWLDEYGSLVF